MIVPLVIQYSKHGHTGSSNAAGSARNLPKLEPKFIVQEGYTGSRDEYIQTRSNFKEKKGGPKGEFYMQLMVCCLLVFPFSVILISNPRALIKPYNNM